MLEQGLRWKPVADGYVLPDVPTRLWAEGRNQKIPLLIGSNLDEGNLFLQGLTLEPAEYEAQMEAVFGPYAEEALALYPVESADDITPAFSRMLTEVGFASTARFAARATSAAGAPAFLYQFTRVPFDNPLGAFHGVEIPYVFGNTEPFELLGQIEQADLDLSAAIMDYWTRFAATGDPNGDRRRSLAALRRRPPTGIWNWETPSLPAPGSTKKPAISPTRCAAWNSRPRPRCLRRPRPLAGAAPSAPPKAGPDHVVHVVRVGVITAVARVTSLSRTAVTMSSWKSLFSWAKGSFSGSITGMKSSCSLDPDRLLQGVVVSRPGQCVVEVEMPDDDRCRRVDGRTFRLLEGPQVFRRAPLGCEGGDLLLHDPSELAAGRSLRPDAWSSSGASTRSARSRR